MLLKKNWPVSVLFLVCTLIYLGQIVFIKPDPIALNRYHLTPTSYVITSLAVAIPYVIIWIVSLVGYQRMKSYTDSIRGSKDGDAFRLLTLSILLLAVWLPVTTVLSTLVAHANAFHLSTESAVRLNNYGNIALLLPAFVIAYLGSERLVGLVKSWRVKSRTSLITTLCFIAFSAFYTWLVLHDPVRNTPSGTVTRATYYESDLMILATIIIPRLIMWYFGIQTAYNIYLYRNRVNGSLYRDALGQLAKGIGGVVCAAIILRIFQSISPTISALKLGQILIVIYVLLIIIAIAYVFIAKGAQKMQKLEEL